jgi:hypothetical protein
MTRLRDRYARAMLLAVVLACAGCVAEQPPAARTVAAYDIPLPSAADRTAFLAMLRREAAVDGFHVDAATDDELRTLSSVSPITLNATVWRGDDVEIVASAMDMVDHQGRVWLTFARGENPVSFALFRARLITSIARRWPQTASLPIMPTGAIPLSADMIRTPSGYVVRPSARATYQLTKE